MTRRSAREERAWRGPLAVVSAAWLTLIAGLPVGCGSEPGRSAATDPVAVDSEWFKDGTAASGLDFVHANGMSGRFYFPEHVAPGVGVWDYDRDGDLDVFFTQGETLDPAALADGPSMTTAPIASSKRQSGGRLYRNDLEVRPDGTRILRFTDITGASGIVTRGYGMGVATGDVDNDGCVDLYVTTFGPNQLFRNNCDGTFVETAKRAGIDDPGFSVSASFVDYDRDGWLDLFVGNYVHYSVATNVICRSVTGQLDYCSPRVYRAQPNRLFRNQGDGTFTDVSMTALVGGDFGPALGVVAADFNADGWPDLFVANDGERNELWMNQQDGTFRNRAALAGVALNADGHAVAGMGVDASDFDNDGDEDVFLTTLSTEMNTLFVNDGTGTFDDSSVRSGLGAPSLAYTGWGTAWIDIDNDGWLDLLTVNGTIQAQGGSSSKPFPYDQRKQLFRNLGDGRFQEVTSQAGTAFELSEVGRGAAFGDLDNDGAVDVIVANANGPARVLTNQLGRRHHWIGLTLLGEKKTPRDMLGARVAVMTSDGRTLWRRAHTDGSYASANDPRVLVGLGQRADRPRVRVIWPDGGTDEFPDVPVDQWTTLRQKDRP